MAVCALATAFPAAASPMSNSASLPTLSDFVLRVSNGNAKELRGVYAEGVFALRVDQQPSNSVDYVTGTAQGLTEFDLAAKYGNVGLLAHNYLSGRYFAQLRPGERIALIFGNGRLEWYRVSRLLRYQALRPRDDMSDFVDLNDAERLTVEQVFRSAYTGDRHVTFQTCIGRDGNASRGRLFVIAEPDGNRYIIRAGT